MTELQGTIPERITMKMWSANATASTSGLSWVHSSGATTATSSTEYRSFYANNTTPTLQSNSTVNLQYENPHRGGLWYDNGIRWGDNPRWITIPAVGEHSSPEYVTAYPPSFYNISGLNIPSKYTIGSFKNNPPSNVCCFNSMFRVYNWYKNKHGKELDSCNELPLYREHGVEWGIALDHCKKHHKLAVQCYQEEYGKMPSLIRKFSKKELDKAIEEKLLREKEKLEKTLQLENAKNKADELLQKWLSPEEYNYLKENNEVEFPSQYEKNVIYVVKKDYSRKVIKKVDGLAVEELCVMPVNSGFVNDDSLLSKIMLLRTNEKEFLEIANSYPL